MWWEEADKDLIVLSARRLVDLVEDLSIKRIYLPKPGCGNGKLSWVSVKPLFSTTNSSSSIIEAPAWYSLLMQNKKQSMPSERASITRKMRIGDLEGYITVGLYDDGKPGEVFLTVQQAGSVERGLSHALALVISLALQRGVLVEEIAQKLEGLRFEPSGLTGKSDIPTVSSLADYIGKWLKMKFGSAR